MRVFNSRIARSDQVSRFLGAPDYALRHAIEHLISAHYFEKLHKLIGPGFMWAKRIRFGSHRGFVSDLEACINASEAEGVEGIPNLIFYSILYLLLQVSVENYRPEVLRLLSELDELLPIGGHNNGPRLKARAEDYAELLRNPLDRAKAFRAIGGGGFTTDFVKAFEREKRGLNRHFLRRAFEEAQFIANLEEKARFMYDLSVELGRAGELDLAFMAIDQLPSTDTDELDLKQNILRRLPGEIARSGKAEEALEAVSLIKSPYDQENSLFEIGRALAAAGLIKEALRIGLDSDEKLLKGVALECNASVAGLIAKVEAIREITNFVEREQRINDLAEIMSKIKLGELSEQEHRRAMLTLRKEGLKFIWLGEYDKALEILKKSDSNFWHFGLAEHADRFIEGLIFEGRYHDAELLITSGFGDSSLRERTEQWREVKRNLDAAFTRGGPQRLLDEIKAFRSTKHLLEALVIGAPVLTKAGKFDELIQLFDANIFEDEAEIIGSKLAIYLARGGMTQGAEEVAVSLPHYAETYLEKIVFAIAGVLARDGKHKKIVPMVKRLIDDPPRRCEILAEIASKLIEVDENQAADVLEDALIEAEYTEETLQNLWIVLTTCAVSLLRAGELEKALIIATDVMHNMPQVWAEILGEYVKDSLSVDKDKAEQVFRDMLEYVVQLSDIKSSHILRCLVCSTSRRKLFIHSKMALDMIPDNDILKPLALAQYAGMLAQEDLNQASELLLRAQTLLMDFREDQDEPRKHPEHNWRERLVMMNKTMKWVDLPSGEHILVKRESNLNDAVITSIEKLITTVGMEGIVQLFENIKFNLKQFQTQTISGLARALAEQGRFSEANHIAKDIYEASLTVNLLEFHYLETHGYLSDAERIADKFVELDIGTGVAMFEILALGYAKSRRTAETLDALGKIPPDWREYGYRTHLVCLASFLKLGEIDGVQTILNNFKNDFWKKLGLCLTEICSIDINSIDLTSRLDEMLDKASELERITISEDIQYWLRVSFSSRLKELKTPEKVLDFIGALSEFELHDDMQVEEAANLARRGLIDDALHLLGEIKNRRVVIDAISLISSRLEDCKSEIKLRAIQKLLAFARLRGLEFTVETISIIAPLMLDNNDPQMSTKLMWKTYEQITQLPGWWNYDVPLGVSE